MKIRSLLTAGLMSVVAAVGIAGPARADDESEFPSCQRWEAVVGVNGSFHEPDVGDWYAYTHQVFVPSASACEDINIVDQLGDTWRWRVRFYPSSGGNYANSWKPGGCSLCLVVVATNVANGTKFRIEGHKLSAGGQQTVYQRNAVIRM